MNTDIRQSISLFIDNYHILKKLLRFKTSAMSIRLYALSYALEGNLVDPDSLVASILTIRNHTKWYSAMRSSRILLAAFLCASGKEVETSFSRLHTCYMALKKTGFWSSMYLPIAAFALYSTTDEGSEITKADTTKQLYRFMKKSRYFPTFSDDYATAAIMASSGRSRDEIKKDMDDTFDHLKQLGLCTSNGLQYLSQILVFDPAMPEEKAKRCQAIAEILNKMHFKTPSLYYGTIGFLAFAGSEWENAIRDAMDTTSLLKLGKCLSLFDKEYGLMIAAALVAKSYVSGELRGYLNSPKMGFSSTLQAIITAQTASCVSASTAITRVTFD